ncbi:MAG: Ig-like domain-containing protein, partial [Candidatus Kerfeldbacteria bacterium]|nr:Ig-like domain-containing protein [Candidatus Kerfeldbacteria bacterium]
GFTVLRGSSYGLTFQAPANASTGVPFPPIFNFRPSTNNSVQSYEIIIKGDQTFTGTTYWDYAFPTPALDASSHCSSSTCNVGYGTGFYRIMAASIPLAPSTTYYWRVKTFSSLFHEITSSSVPLESTNISSFTTGSLVDTMPPNIQFRPVMQLKTGADRVLIARVGDNVATYNSSPALSTSLVYCNSSTSCTPGTSISGVYVAAGYWKYTIPQAVVDHTDSAANGIRYYLTASDGTNSTSFKQPDGTTPFTITIAALATTHKLVGAVTDQAAACLAGVYVFAEGYSFNNLSGATSCAGGTYSLGSIPPGTYDLVAFKDGYGDRRLQGVFAIPSADSTPTYNFSLTSGASGGSGGSFSRPHVKFTGPPDNMTGIPGGLTGFKIFMAFDRAMSSSSVTSPGNILLKKFSGSTDETGSSGTINGATVSGTLGATITYYAQNTDGNIGPLESNLAVITPTASFGDNKTIVVIVTPGVTDTSANSVEGNQPDGAYVFTFSTGSTFTSGGGGGGGGTFGSGAFNPPYVVGTTPKPGTPSIPLNTKLALTFSQAMDSTTLTSNTIKLYTVSNNNESLIDTSSWSYSLDTTKTIAILAPSSNLTASTQYRLKALGGVKSAIGLGLMAPGSESLVAFQADFTTGTATDIGAPSKLGSYPDNNATSVPVNSGAIMVAFNKALDPSTISTSTVSLAVGSSTVSGTVSYDDTKNAVLFTPKVALSASTSYTLTISTGVKGLNGTAISSAYSISFTTGSADTVAPTISFANGSDYAIAVTYSEPMLAVNATDTTNFGASVLNPAKYTLNSASLPSSVVMRYEADKNTVMIEGLALTSGSSFTLTVTGVKDLSGNTISGTPSIGGTVLSSASSGGMLGPGVISGGSFAAPTGPNYATSGISYMPPAMARPFNTGAGVTTIYGVEIPISKQIPASGKIVLAFPTGFDVSGAKKDPNSPPNSDINGPGAGAVVFGTATETPQSGGAGADGVTVDTVARTVTVTLGAVPTRSEYSDTHDYLRLDIAGLKNSTIPMDFGTSGYTVDIKTYSGTTLLDSSVSQPFFIGASGNYKIDVTVATASNVTGTMKVLVGSPMTGMQDQTVTFTNGTSSTVASFTGLSDGEYMVFTDSMFTNTANNDEWSGQAMPTSVRISGADAAKTITLSKLTGAAGTAAVKVFVKGPANEPVEVFAGSPSGFIRKKVTLDGNATNYDTITLALTKSQNWFVGVGPQMPDMSMSGPPPAPSYMPPKPWEVNIAAGGTFKEDSVDVNAPICVNPDKDVANDGCVSFVLQSAGLTINGTVQDGAGNAIANAEVYGYTPQGGFGTHAQASAQGTFTLKVIAGSYSVGAFVPGMPSGQEQSVVVTAGGVYAGGSTTVTTNVIIKLSKPDYTITGKVTDGTTVINGASVYAYRTDGPGNAQALTDTQGAYTLYVGSGSWKVGTFLPGYGQLPEKSLTVASANLTNQNFAPTTADFGTINGTVFSSADATIDANEGIAGAFVHVEGTPTSGGFSANDASTAADGTYSLRVPAGSGYTIRVFKPGRGQMASVDANLAAITAFSVTAGGTVTKNVRTGALNTITITFSGTVSQAFVDVFNTTNNMGNHAEVKNGASATMQLPSGTYGVKVFVPGVDAAGLALSDTSGIGTTVLAGTTVGSNVTVDGNEGITVTLPAMRIVSGTVYKTSLDTGNELEKAWVELMDDTVGIRFGTLTAANGTFSLQAKAGTYKLQAMKPGYVGAPNALTVSDTADSTGNNVILTQASITVSGQVKIGSTGASRAFVRAERVGAVGMAGAPADASGNYTLSLSSGSWRVYGVAEGYQEAEYGTVVTSSLTNANITLSGTVALNPPKAQSITPAQGGELIDSVAGVKLTIPASALGSSTSSGQVQAKETNNLTKTSSAKIAGNKGKEIKATDSSGNPINSLSGSITVEMTYSAADLTSLGIAEDSADESKLNLSYWDDTANNWVTVPGTIDTATNTVRGNTDHLTIFAIVLPFVATAASAATVAPVTTSGGGTLSSGFSAGTLASTFSLNSGASTTVSSTVTLNLSSTNATQVTISESPDFSGASWQTYAPTVTYNLSSGSGLKTVYVKYRDVNGTVSSRLSANITLNPGATAEEITAPALKPVSEAERAAQVLTITKEAAKVATVEAEAMATEVGVKRDTGLEQRYSSTIVARVVVASTPAASKARVVNFVTYGTPTTTSLGAGERAGVVNSFRAAFGKVPTTEADWSDVIKIANGRFPSVSNATREKSVEGTFKKIYQRSSVRTQANDDAAVVVMAYGLRTATRNLNSEKVAIKSFKVIFGKAPTTASDWDAVRAIAYSGARR